MEKLMKLIEQKKREGKEMDPADRDAKLSMLQELHGQMSKMMADDLSPEKMDKAKLVIGADDKEGLADGLEKAKEMLEHSPEDGDKEMPDEEEGLEDEHDQEGEDKDESESPDMLTDQHDELSPEEELLLKKLLAKSQKRA